MKFLPSVIFGLSFAIDMGATWAASTPSWPEQCLDLHQQAAGSVVVKQYSVAFDKKPAGIETFCLLTTDEKDIIFQWTSNAIHKFLGSTSIRHCRKEEWLKLDGDIEPPRESAHLGEMQAWTNVATDGTHSLASFLDQVPKPSSIRAERQPDGSYRYSLEDLVSGAEKKEWSVREAALRTPWTELMIPAASVNMMDPVRYRVSTDTSVVEHEADPSVGVPHRSYRIDGGDFEFVALFRADDGTMLKMQGNDASADVDMVLIEQTTEERTCPHPDHLD